jgi:hypothetical protein
MASYMESTSFQKLNICALYFTISDFSNMAEFFPHNTNMTEKIPFTQ